MLNHMRLPIIQSAVKVITVTLGLQLACNVLLVFIAIQVLCHRLQTLVQLVDIAQLQVSFKVALLGHMVL